MPRTFLTDSHRVFVFAVTRDTLLRLRALGRVMLLVMVIRLLMHAVGLLPSLK
jgi:hypothetical protein